MERFSPLTEDLRQLLLSAAKIPGKYSGDVVVLASKIQVILRVVTLSLFLALGMTEKYEKAERA